jgi:predicted GIY-YIG superfamily endonuclease
LDEIDLTREIEIDGIRLSGPFSYRAALQCIKSEAASCGVYILEDMAQTARYIGRSANISHRMIEHFYHLRNGTHPKRELQMARTEKVVYLKFCGSEEEAIELERRLLQATQHDRAFLNFAINPERNGDWKPGYIHPNAGTTRSADFGQKLSEIFKEQYKNGRVPPQLGMPLSDDTKRKIGNKNKGRIKSPDEIAKTQETKALNGFKSKINRPVVISGIAYDRIIDASNVLGIHRETLKHRIESSNPLYADYHYKPRS